MHGVSLLEPPYGGSNILEKISQIFNPFLTSGQVHRHVDESIPSFRGLWWMFSFLLHFP